jgi:hypothetical protein
MQMPAKALFADRHSAHAAVEQLAQAGFGRDDVSVAMSDETHDREFGPSLSTRSGVHPAPHAGGVLGSIVAGLAPVTMSGGIRLKIGGPLLDAVIRSGALPAALLAVGLVVSEARAVGDGLLNGNIVVGVHASSDRSALAMQLLELSGGEALQAA